jgi:hypothetical protein
MVGWAMKYVYLSVIAICTLINTASTSLALDAIALSVEHNIPLSKLLVADNDVNIALESLSLAELTEVRT